MATSPSSDALRLLACVPAPIRDRDRYVGDHVIRHYRPLGLAFLLRDLGLPADTPELTIVGGIGRLTLRHGSEEWAPAVLDRPVQPSPLPAGPELAEARMGVCRACSDWREGRCGATGCGCSGAGRAEWLAGRCPRGLWPEG